VAAIARLQDLHLFLASTKPIPPSAEDHTYLYLDLGASTITKTMHFSFSYGLEGLEYGTSD